MNRRNGRRPFVGRLLEAVNLFPIYDLGHMESDLACPVDVVKLRTKEHCVAEESVELHQLEMEQS